ncbi:glycosyltransferase family 2 protein [Neotabrizicola sp. sgz301269]|uniref:glycosyltransferase family 2 protein n=1 Tax=Neotabrizicola sp. sgz301269 TaxID=3276282 RepID=UPI00376F8E8E
MADQGDREAGFGVDRAPSFALDVPGLPRFIDGLLCCDGRLRLFFGGGAQSSALLPAGIAELREISGGLMAVLPGREGALRLGLADGSDVVVPVASAQDGLFVGKRVLLLLRVAETPGQIAESLSWHGKMGAEAALVVNRAPEGDGFAEALCAACAGIMPLRLLQLTLPSGKAGIGPETHPFLAPDAPGKDRMAPPEPDEWRSPLDEAVLYEWMKWRYLARARSVVSLEACDILPPPDGPSAFEAAETAGTVLLAGRRAYPWRLRAGQAAGFGDHVCRPFDMRRGSARWACAPEKLGLEQTWRQTRISFANPRQVLPFWRCMALRVAAADGAPLAPKTALIEDAGLLALAEALGARPVRPPASARKAAPAPDSGQAPATRRVAIVTTMKNEGPFILEWLAYHRAIGVTDFLIYTNDCSDGTDTMLQMLAGKGLCQWRENPFRDMDLKPQHAALQAAESEAVLQAADWAICMDVDEFIDVKLGDGTLKALFTAMEAALPGANMIALTWRLFGNGEVRDYEDRFLLEQFTRCAPELVRKPHQAWGFKTLFRTLEIYKKLGVHRPKGLKPDLWDQVRWLNGSGREMPKEMFRNGWRSTLETYGYDWVQLNHYAVRSAESFLVKRDRGRVNHVDRDQGLNYWFRMNHNAQEDRSIQRMIPALQAEWDRLMADPEIAAAHAYSVRCHRAKIAELRATETYQRFYEELTGPRMERLCRMQAHFGSAVFNAGPQVIPADLHEREIAPDFFFTVQHEGEAQH